MDKLYANDLKLFEIILKMQHLKTKVVHSCEKHKYQPLLFDCASRLELIADMTAAIFCPLKEICLGKRRHQ